jgi:hypothetical protein
MVLRQEAPEWEASLSYMERPCLKKKANNKTPLNVGHWNAHISVAFRKKFSKSLQFFFWW